MFRRLLDLREPLLSARLLREEVLDSPLLPADRARLAESFLEGNSGAALPRPALEEALRLAADPRLPVVEREALERLASAAGARGPRTGPGLPFAGGAPPPPEDVPELFDELLARVNAPVAVEGWPAPVRAFGLHFLLLLVQPWEGEPAACAAAAEAWLLAADGFRADRMRLPGPERPGSASGARLDADGFAAGRLERLTESLVGSHALVRRATLRAVLLAWLASPDTRLNARQRGLVRLLADADPGRTLTFRHYVRLHAGRGAPSLRTLQRDLRALRERGVVRERGGAIGLDPDFLAFGSGQDAEPRT